VYLRVRIKGYICKNALIVVAERFSSRSKLFLSKLLWFQIRFLGWFIILLWYVVYR
jgi:hypothetical protein